MRVLIYSDIHANLEALEAVAAAAAGCDSSLCLGDIVGYGASPNPASAWVQRNSLVVIRGNHDRACASLHGLEWFNPTAATAARWTHDQLQPDAMEWLQLLPAGPKLWENHCLVHGSPLDEDEYLVTAAQAAGVFAATSAWVHWFGHTHLQGGFGLDDDQVRELNAKPAAGDSAAVTRLQLKPEVRYLLNPGSVGQPRDGDWRAAFAILDTATGVVEMRRVPYDIATAQRRIIEAGLPAGLAQRLAKGK
ncbi:MAG: metallophosphoesterase family protein [Terriglobales bacterium]